jgi:hypothetical protein
MSAEWPERPSLLAQMFRERVAFPSKPFFAVKQIGNLCDKQLRIACEMLELGLA